MKYSIPQNIFEKDVWDSQGKIHVSQDMTKEEAERLKIIFPSVTILEEPKPKSKLKKNSFKEEKGEESN